MTSEKKPAEPQTEEWVHGSLASRLRMRVVPQPWREGFALYITQATYPVGGCAYTSVVTDLKLQRITLAEAQSLMDELYAAGIRPSDQGTAGQLSATQHHLRDMRILVASFMKLDTLQDAPRVR